MSGHSKWASIKHKKGAADAKRGALFTKLARAITVAAREGGGDPVGNASLATAIEKAKSYSMPKDNIERAIAKGAGADKDAENYEEVIYEGYGPAGVALLIQTLTENRNRTGSDVRNMLTKSGGNLGEPGSVSWIFEKKGVIRVVGEHIEDDFFPAIDAGAEDIVEDHGTFEIVTEPADLAAAREALESAGIEIEAAEVTQRPTTRVELTDTDAVKLFRLIDVLEENDDVAEVHANFDVSDAVLEQLAAD